MPSLRRVVPSSGQHEGQWSYIDWRLCNVSLFNKLIKSSCTNQFNHRYRIISSTNKQFSTNLQNKSMTIDMNGALFNTLHCSAARMRGLSGVWDPQEQCPNTSTFLKTSLINYI